MRLLHWLLGTPRGLWAYGMGMFLLGTVVTVGAYLVGHALT